MSCGASLFNLQLALSHVGYETPTERRPDPDDAAKDGELAASSPLLGVIGTENDGPDDWLGAGQALERVLLRARVSGVSASFLDQPIEVPDLRPRVRELAGAGGFPQLLVRLGCGPDARPTPGRPVQDVLSEA